jgi:allantoinase
MTPPGTRRLPGTDNPYVEWSPIRDRPKLQWPGDARVAVCVVVSIEHLEWDPPPDAVPAPSAVGYGPYPRAFQIVGVSRPEYGSRVGAFRLLRVLDANEIRPMVAIDAALLPARQRLVAEFKDRAAEFIGHGIALSRTIHEGMDEDRERDHISSSLEALEQATGSRPVGWLGAEYGESKRTPALLASLGLHYVCDWSNDEQPYAMTTTGPLVALPVAVDLDDVMAEKVRRLPAWRWAKMVIDSVEQLSHDGKESGRLLILNLHAHVSGQPFRIKYVDSVLRAIKDEQYAWLTTGAEVVKWFVSNPPFVNSASGGS